MGCEGKAVLGHTGLIMGCLGEEPKVEKVKGSGDLGRHRSGKIEE